MDASGEDTFTSGAVLNGKYRLDRELGRGGMGQVFAATNLALEAPVAIKVLHAGARPSRALASRFIQEARAAAQVRHNNIVGVLDVGQDEATGALFIVQEFLQGRDLKRAVSSYGVFPPAAAIELLLPVMRALSFAHSKGVVHRDLKPDNIFLCDTSDGTVPKVIDFGIAKVTDAHGVSAQMTHTSQVLGTPYFMSPEQARGDRAVDHRTDVWSLGVVLYHMLTRRHPYEGATANLIIAQIISHAPTPVTAFAPTLPGPVVALLEGALQYDATHRYPSMDAFWEAARTCLSALGVQVVPGGYRQPLTPYEFAPASKHAVMPLNEGVTIAPQVVDSSATATAPRPRTTLWAVLAVLALAAAVVGYASGRKQPEASTVAPPRSAPRPFAAAPTRTENANAPSTTARPAAPPPSTSPAAQAPTIPALPAAAAPTVASAPASPAPSTPSANDRPHAPRRQRSAAGPHLLPLTTTQPRPPQPAPLQGANPFY